MRSLEDIAPRTVMVLEKLAQAREPTHLGRMAKISSALRAAALRKEAGLLGMMGSAAKSIGSAYGGALKAAPVKTLGATALGAVGTYGAVKAGQGAYQKHMAGTDPNTHKMLNGSMPTPPGVA